MSAPAVWTGDELIVWGGLTAKGEILASGASYDPEADEWTELPAAPGQARAGHNAVWSGEEVLFWGGTGADNISPATEGLAYSRASEEWRVLPPAPIPVRAGSQMVWSGEEMLVWGGMPIGQAGDSIWNESEFAAYDPSSDRWRRLRNAPTAATGNAQSWEVDGRMFVYGGERVMSFDAALNEWSEPSDSIPAPPPTAESVELQMACTGGPAIAAAHTDRFVFVWTGGCFATRGLVFGLESRKWGTTIDIPLMQGTWAVEGDGWIYIGGSVPTGVDVYRYSIRENTLVRAAHPSVDIVPGSQAVWTGQELLVFNGSRGIDQPRPGAAFTPQPPFESPQTSAL